MTDGRTDGQTDRRTDERVLRVVIVGTVVGTGRRVLSSYYSILPRFSVTQMPINWHRPPGQEDGIELKFSIML